MGKIQDFFKQGEFYTHLQETLDSLAQKGKKNGKAIKKLSDNDLQLANDMKLLRQENTFLKDRINKLEEKIWSFSNSSPEKVIYINESDKESNKQLPHQDSQ